MLMAVSYTHLDVYKRQALLSPCLLRGQGEGLAAVPVSDLSLIHI